MAFLVTYLLEKVFFLRHEFKKFDYDNIELIKQKRQELIRDLEVRTGLSINRLEVGRIDFPEDLPGWYLLVCEDNNWISSPDDDISAPDNGTMIERIARPGLIILLLVSLSQGMSGQQQDFQRLPGSRQD